MFLLNVAVMLKKHDLQQINQISNTYEVVQIILTRENFFPNLYFFSIKFHQVCLQYNDVATDICS